MMDPFHVVRLAGDALDRRRRRCPRPTPPPDPTDHPLHRGRAHDPLYRARRTLHTGVDLLTDKQQQRLETLFADDAHVQVQAAWGIYQCMIPAYRQPDRAQGRELMVKLIDALSHGVPKPLTEPDHPRPHPEEAGRRRAGLHPMTVKHACLASSTGSSSFSGVHHDHAADHRGLVTAM